MRSTMSPFLWNRENLWRLWAAPQREITLLHLLGGVDRPTSGKVFVQGEDVYQMNSDPAGNFRRRQVGLIYQFYNLIPILNVKENITLPCELDGRKVDEERLAELIADLGLSDRVNHLPNQLSAASSNGFPSAGR